MSRLTLAGRLLCLALMPWSLAVPLARVSAQDSTVVVTPGSGQEAPVPIAIAPLFTDQPQLADLARNIRDVIANDLDRSGRFTVINPAAYPPGPVDPNALPAFEAWAAIQASDLVTGAVRAEAGGLRVEFRLWDTLGRAQKVGQAFNLSQEQWRVVAHSIADAVYTQITGDGPYFNTRIVYVAEGGDTRNRNKRLAIMDQDGANHQYLTSGQPPVVTPRFSPDGRSVALMFVPRDVPSVALLNLDSSRTERLLRTNNLSFAPRFSPDGRRVAVSVTNDGNTDIVEVDLATRQTRPLITGAAIDTSPSYSPDGSQIVFESDRGGSQQLYVASASGGDARRISFGDGRYATPVWSPDGRWIAFTKQQRGSFSIGIMKPDGSDEEILTTAYLTESPTWAPNSRVLMYYKESPSGGGTGRQTNLYQIDIGAKKEVLVPTPGSASDPSWSPLLQ